MPKRRIRSRSPHVASADGTSPTMTAASKRSSMPSSHQPRRQRRPHSQSPGAVCSQPGEGAPAASLAVTSSSSSSSSTSSSTSSSSKRRHESTDLKEFSYQRSGRAVRRSKDADGREIDSGNRHEGGRKSDERVLGSSIVEKLPLNESADLSGKSRERGNRKDGGRAASPRSAVGFGVRSRDKGLQGNESRNSGNIDVPTSNVSCTGESGDRHGRDWNEKSPGRGRRGASGNGSGWMDGERGLRRDRGVRRSSKERLLPPEAFQHNRYDLKKESSNVKKVSTSPPPQKRARSREKSEEKKPVRDSSLEKRHVLKDEIRPDVDEDELEKVPSEKVSNESMSGNSIGDNLEVPKSAEGGEVFSDFGESDEEILTKEGGHDLGDELSVTIGDMRSTIRPESRTSSQKSAPCQSKYSTDVLDISGDLDEVSQGEDEEEMNETKNTLDVDWSDLMAKPGGNAYRVDETGVLKKRWCLANILNKVGLSEPLVGKKKYDELVALANKDVDGG